MTIQIIHTRRRRGQRNLDYSIKFVPLGDLCEERNAADEVTPCDFFIKTTRSCKKHNVKLHWKYDISHRLAARPLYVKCDLCK